MTVVGDVGCLSGLVGGWLVGARGGFPCLTSCGCCSYLWGRGGVVG